MLLTLAAAGAGATSARAEERANCGYPGVQVSYAEPADLRIACDALAATVLYFRNIGFNVEPKFSLTFGDDGHPAGTVSGLGHFDAKSLHIAVHPASPSVKPWRLRWSNKLAASFVLHEMVHMAVLQILGGDPERWPREWHEFATYAVQLALMDRKLLHEVLASTASVRPFATLWELNEFTYAMDPEVFAVAAYKTYRERGAEKFMRQLLRAEIAPPAPVSFPHPVIPDRNPNQ